MLWRELINSSLNFQHSVRLINRRQFPLLNTFAMTSTTAKQYNVEHDKAQQEFYIQMGEQRAKLQYQLRDGVYDMFHTFVPPEMRGGGIAQYLAHAAFDHVVENDSKMRLTCSYLDHLNKKEQNPKYTKHVV